MICDNCHHLNKSHHTDSLDCIHITWYCEKRKFNVLYEVIRSDKFLERYYGYEKIEVIIRPNVDKCSQHAPKMKKITDFTEGSTTTFIST